MSNQGDTVKVRNVLLVYHRWLSFFDRNDLAEYKPLFKMDGIPSPDVYYTVLGIWWLSEKTFPVAVIQDPMSRQVYVIADTNEALIYIDIKITPEDFYTEIIGKEDIPMPDTVTFTVIDNISIFSIKVLTLSEALESCEAVGISLMYSVRIPNTTLGIIANFSNDTADFKALVYRKNGLSR